MEAGGYFGELVGHFHGLTIGQCSLKRPNQGGIFVEFGACAGVPRFGHPGYGFGIPPTTQAPPHPHQPMLPTSPHPQAHLLPTVKHNPHKQSSCQTSLPTRPHPARHAYPTSHVKHYLPTRYDMHTTYTQSSTIFSALPSH